MTENTERAMRRLRNERRSLRRPACFRKDACGKRGLSLERAVEPRVSKAFRVRARKAFLFLARARAGRKGRLFRDAGGVSPAKRWDGARGRRARREAGERS